MVEEKVPPQAGRLRVAGARTTTWRGAGLHGEALDRGATPHRRERGGGGRCDGRKRLQREDSPVRLMEGTRRVSQQIPTVTAMSGAAGAAGCGGAAAGSPMQAAARASLMFHLQRN